MLLACDIGNTYCKLGVYSDNKLLRYDRLETKSITPYILSKFEFKEVAISSVVPEATERLKKMLIENFGIEPYIITKNSKFSLSIDYKTPETLGIDRICGACGAYALYRKNYTNNNESLPTNSIISVDCGTATTINVILQGNIFSGGIIAPGLTMMSKMLNNNTAQLPEVNISDFEGHIGKSTKEAIASGCINSMVGLIERLYTLVKNEHSSDTYLFITGGNAKFISKYLDVPHDFIPDLVLRGIKEIHSLNK